MYLLTHSLSPVLVLVVVMGSMELKSSRSLMLILRFSFFASLVSIFSKICKAVSSCVRSDCLHTLKSLFQVDLGFNPDETTSSVAERKMTKETVCTHLDL